MMIRRAEKKDIPEILGLLEQVLELHAALRPDIFVPGTTKYSINELTDMMVDDQRPIYVAVEEDRVAGYAFCVLQKQPFSNTMVPFTTCYVDDLCVDQAFRGRGIGKELFEYVKHEAVHYGCYEVTLNVWEGNDGARAFYEQMGMRVKETQMEYVL